MLETSIQQRVQDNLNRTEAGVTTKIQGWINEAKLKIEQRLDMEYMRTSAVLGTISNTTFSLALPARFKHQFLVRFRKLTPNEELGWTPIPKLSELELLAVNTYQSPGVLIVGDPTGYDMTELNIVFYPTPRTTDTWSIWMGYYQFSADWVFGVTDEHYLAKFAYPSLIDWATYLGFKYYGQIQDAGDWLMKFEGRPGEQGHGTYHEFVKHENLRALEGEFTLRPHSGANDQRPSGGVTRPLIGWRI